MSVAVIEGRTTDVYNQESERARDGEVFNYLKNSKYKDIPEQYIHMLISYCRAARLDPMADVAHIVGYSQQDKDTKKWSKIYNILPGIAKYRIQGYRTGHCLGVSAPKFGPIIEEQIGTALVKYPEWCIVTVRMFVNGQIAEYEGFEYWKEAYSPKSATDPTPNKIWLKRPNGQAAKCAEAQAWRKACPELTGGQATFEEMEGKHFHNESGNQELLEHQEDVVERIKLRKKAKSELPMVMEGKFEDGSLIAGKFEANSIKPMFQEAQIDEPNPQIKCLFDMLKNANDTVTKRVSDYMTNNEVTELSENRMKLLIVSIIGSFPELKRQISPEHNKLIDEIMA